MLHLNPNEVIILTGAKQRVQPDLMGSPTDMKLKGSYCRFRQGTIPCCHPRTYHHSTGGNDRRYHDSSSTRPILIVLFVVSTHASGNAHVKYASVHKSYLGEFRDVVFIYPHLLWKQRKPFESSRTSYKSCCASRRSRSGFYLRNFKELRNPRHACQEPLVDLQPVFTLASLHLEEFFWRAERVKYDSIWVILLTDLSEILLPSRLMMPSL